MEDWTNTLARTRLMNEHGDRNKVQKTLEAAIEDFSGVGETRRSHLLDFIKTCLTPEQRESLYKGAGNMYQAPLINLADSILANSAKSGVWIMLHSLLKQITFNILKLGTEDWVKPGEYTPASVGISDDASPVDFYRKLKRAMLLEKVVPIPPPDSSIREPDDLLIEATSTSCEGFRPLLFDCTTVLTTEPSTSSDIVEEEKQEKTPQPEHFLDFFRSLLTKDVAATQPQPTKFSLYDIIDGLN